MLLAWSRRDAYTLGFGPFPVIFSINLFGTPSVLFRRGFTKNSLLPGTEVVVDGYQAKDGSKRANGRDLTLPDGRRLFLGSSGTGAPYELQPQTQKAK